MGLLRKEVGATMAGKRKRLRRGRLFGVLRAREWVMVHDLVAEVMVVTSYTCDGGWMCGLPWDGDHGVVESDARGELQRWQSMEKGLRGGGHGGAPMMKRRSRGEGTAGGWC